MKSAWQPATQLDRQRTISTSRWLLLFLLLVLVSDRKDFLATSSHSLWIAKHFQFRCWGCVAVTGCLWMTSSLCVCKKICHLWSRNWLNSRSGFEMIRQQSHRKSLILLSRSVYNVGLERLFSVCRATPLLTPLWYFQVYVPLTRAFISIRFLIEDVLLLCHIQWNSTAVVMTTRTLWRWFWTQTGMLSAISLCWSGSPTLSGRETIACEVSSSRWRIHTLSRREKSYWKRNRSTVQSITFPSPVQSLAVIPFVFIMNGTQKGTISLKLARAMRATHWSAAQSAEVAICDNTLQSESDSLGGIENTLRSSANFSSSRFEQSRSHSITTLFDKNTIFSGHRGKYQSLYDLIMNRKQTPSSQMLRNGMTLSNDLLNPFRSCLQVTQSSQNRLDECNWSHFVGLLSDWTLIVLMP
jgi:hypothetical protein